MSQTMFIVVFFDIALILKMFPFISGEHYVQRYFIKWILNGMNTFSILLCIKIILIEYFT